MVDSRVIVKQYCTDFAMADSLLLPLIDQDSR